ncbi:hypothetical protein V0M98_24405 [Pseudomonas silesiensis]|uniref:hypothetical protein n=1 Tax=Pseudomonas silesiensis TaxID=1853130 RepID=UPI0030CC0FF9
MNGLRAKVVGGVLAVAGIVGAALINYFVENGALPAWLTSVLGWIKEVLTLTTPWAVWELSLPILVIGGVSVAFTYGETAKIKEQGNQIDALSNELESVKSRFEKMENAHGKLKAVHDGVVELYANLEVSNSELVAVNTELKKSVSSMSQPAKSDKLSVNSLSQEQLSVFEFVGGRLDSGYDVYVDTVVRGLRLSLLTAEDFLDALCDLKFLERYDSLIEAECFVLTPAGRSCFLGLKRSVSIKPVTRHG